MGWDFRFEARSAFALSSVETTGYASGSVGTTGYTSGASLRYVYSPTRFRPEWRAFDFENLYLAPDLNGVPLQNKYLDPDSEQAPHFHTEGDKVFLGPCESVTVQ
jgi:hypothetical protein